MRVATEFISTAKLLREKIVDHEHRADHEKRIAVLEVRSGVA
jgi:hypothetical protein